MDLRKLCRDLNGVEVGDAIACFFVDKDANVQAMVTPMSIIIQSPAQTVEIALDTVSSVYHDPHTHRITVITNNGRIEIAPTSNK